MSILLYNNEAYEERYTSSLIRSFTQGNFVQGLTQPEESKKYIEQLNRRIKRHTQAISFHPEMVNASTNQLTGGSCSVISLQVAVKALEAVRLMDSRPEIPTAAKANRIINLIGQEVEKLYRDACSGNSKNERCKQIRTMQQALNTIHIDRTDAIEHPVREKVKGIASLMELEVIHSTKELQVQGNDALDEELKHEMENLDEGVYLLRIIQESNNHKLEVHGHSVLYIKTQGIELYFDPVLGFYQLFSEEEEHLVLNALKSALRRFEVSKLSFHKLVKDPESVSYINPPLNGRFPVGCKRLQDDSLEFDLYYPASIHSKSLGKKLSVIKEGRLAESEFNSRAELHAPAMTNLNCPLLLFSPGLGNSPEDYVHLVEELASHGYIVLALNHPGSCLYERRNMGVQSVLPRMEEEEIIAQGYIRAKQIAIHADKIQKGEKTVLEEHIGAIFNRRLLWRLRPFPRRFCSHQSLPPHRKHQGSAGPGWKNPTFRRRRKDRTAYLHRHCGAGKERQGTVQCSPLSF